MRWTLMLRIRSESYDFARVTRGLAQGVYYTQFIAIKKCFVLALLYLFGIAAFLLWLGFLDFSVLGWVLVLGIRRGDRRRSWKGRSAQA